VLPTARFLNDAELEQIDRQIRSVACAYFDGDRSDDAQVQARKDIAGLLAATGLAMSVAIDRSQAHLAGITWDRQFSHDLAEILDDFIFERVTGDSWNSTLDLARVAAGQSASGWARMLMRSAVVSLARRYAASIVRTRPTDLSGFDQTSAQPGHQGNPMSHIGNAAPVLAASSATIAATSEDDRCDEAAAMIDTMSYGLGEDARQAVVVASLSWYLDLPYPWPQPASVRSWAAQHVDGPRSAVRAIEHIAADPPGNPHPLAAMFEGWSQKQLADLALGHPHMAFAWITGATAARPGPARSLAITLGKSMASIDATPEWGAAARRFTKALRAAMSCATRSFGSKDLTVKDDEAIFADAAALDIAAAELAGFPGAPLGTDPVEIINRAVGLLLDSEYELAIKSENLRLAAAS
jgi:hypothetical protein